jgi:hypothetical protein
VRAATPSAVAARPIAPVALAVASPGAARAGGASGTPPAIIDVRFASGMPRDWLDNAPYAGWSDGAYRLRARQAARFVAVAAPVGDPPDDLVVSATFRKTGGPPGGGYGVIMRDQGPAPRDGVNQTINAYVFETGDLGEFGVWRRDGDRWVDLVPWTRSPTVRVGGSPNELVVRAVADTLVFTVNNVEVANLQDSTWSSGRVGIFVGGDYNEVALDHFAIQAPN